MGSFKDVVGHKDILKYISSAVENNRVSHAYILNGERGSGKRMLANLFATTLLCESGNSEPCGKCHSCRQAESGNHPDIIRVTHEKPNSISVDDIRTQVNNTVDIKPYQGPYKVYIIPQADLMTPQAQNAILKTIEEPPAYAVFLLLTENAEMLLPTINSRCVMLKLRNIKDTLIRKYLMENLEIPDYKADMCTAFAQGNVGKAILLAGSQTFNELKDQTIRLVRKLRDTEVADIMSEVKAIEEFEQIDDFFDLLLLWYRDVLIYKASGSDAKLIYKDQANEIARQAEDCFFDGLNRILDGISQARRRLHFNVNQDMTLELLFLLIKENL